ncbi:hypothetical protein COX00_02505 [Candidatus Uhrbacteria bacterium CG22_combo_CG10-13_8_21_14_all_47_17]|uniref:Uncharacterized protein n=1 Tax=Candidatus Uhrbacteria bacterium CG22_combo_CG10-13_8_21_14_all_47_17 TaxID=1975041 RepID=A0A2H0BSC3_9BACT|nr:MAG: hypothetical protein COX00_02505 [Candidatus Uhrbacteria bacterium CG22_combo_CG10-13_8_21_14_all_47_17]
MKSSHALPSSSSKKVSFTSAPAEGSSPVHIMPLLPRCFSATTEALQEAIRYDKRMASFLIFLFCGIP